jgi:hypothetical protein
MLPPELNSITWNRETATSSGTSEENLHLPRTTKNLYEQKIFQKNKVKEINNTHNTNNSCEYAFLY